MTARSTDMSSFGISDTTTTDSEAIVANANPGPNQLDPSHDLHPLAAGFADVRTGDSLATASRASARIRASASADGRSALAMCTWYSAARRSSSWAEAGSCFTASLPVARATC
ncbi:MAG: hypothetical protein IPO58_17415 [Betaproteobacteria bacterium]|nr:hypothetical protein [Betaproteobacteria bacterium]